MRTGCRIDNSTRRLCCGTAVSVANPARDGATEPTDNKSVKGVAVPGFLVSGTIENARVPCPVG